ncbi:bifunctional indole-3-glycerol phosphate synthase/phosphoribosylanthranilate isomerase [Helicobacter cappadocius]|uniref:N-(5'-phosphoribosyl)anthranilate isomerase n=1 Tax=Helicobacter cappadocius TaxID=3063998 RepID=A0AA90PIV5_9HELI|nr:MULTISPECIES: bifunctional indole-3-glycerol phosphate synthase/phosphoribosylanthranilate isomerase [unclassified Helicobacter]MDO7252938.1 bifunctional indole-3-glycerol phosphate synthase/phosphoribosylanthranilate isomerase [Helicobacter sp. faydin-H75]MDP2539072.1 bifunctional indole-3-glycerol phosphate synthase/phosphoribosylanthranilate isomerase [Helicobacter sp. faydin-H76]
MTMVEVLKNITQKRDCKISNLGFGFGHRIPQKREVPLSPPKFDPNTPLMIAEIKRASPSAGKIGDISEPTNLAQIYLNNGAKVISILTEEDYFNGSLIDLMSVKNTFKNTTILRKDFIQYAEEIEISYLAGADMVLIIIAMFMDDKAKEIELQKILSECKKYSLTPLFEIHNQRECDFALKLEPSILGINSRSLHTFEIDKNKALNLKSLIPNSIKTIFESGIHSSFDGYLAGSFGFDGMLCGSYLVKNEGKNLPNLIKAYQKGKKQKNSFFSAVFQKLYSNATPIIKICGITNIDDAISCAEAGADMIGLIMVKQSPRYQDQKSIKEISKALNKLYPNILKVGVITNEKSSLISAKELLKEGILDCLQLHSCDPFSPNNFASTDLREADFNFYICVNLEDISEYPKDFVSPFVLLDSKCVLGGGSGKSIPLEELQKLKNNGIDLFIAGGIGEQNISEILALKPKMVDINSKVESAVGKKDIMKVKNIIQIIKTYPN